MRVFADLHHFDLYYSLQLLFEKRLNGELWRPIGMDWQKHGYWDLNQDLTLAYLLLSEESGFCAEQLEAYGDLTGFDWAVMSLHLPRIGGITPLEDGRCLVLDRSKGEFQRAITLEAFKNTHFDILVSTVPQHFPLFEQLRQKYQPHAKHIFYASAVGQKLPAEAKNVILNSPPDGDLPDMNHVYCRQEFDLSVFAPKPPAANLKSVRSYVHFPVTETIWSQLGLDWDFRFVGKTLGPLKDIVVRSTDLAKTIAESGFTLHIKPGGESFGHILHNSFAIGRPVIINGDDFLGTQGGELLTKKTCFDVDWLSPKGLRKALIEATEEPERYQEMHQACLDRFKQVVDFDEDERNIRQFLQDLR